MADQINAAAILEELGPDYADSKALEGVTDTTALAKRFIDTQVKVGVLDAKHKEEMTSVIQKLPAGATDVQKTEYETLLRKELTTVNPNLASPETVEAYESKPVNGVSWPSEIEQVFKQAFLDEGVPVGAYARIREKIDNCRATAQNQEVEAENQKYNTECDNFKTANPGDKLVIGARTALKALLQFASPEQKDLTDAIKANKLLENPGDLDAIRKIGIWPSTLTNWKLIGEAMKSDTAITNEGVPAGAGDGKPAEGTVESVIATTYTHPSSIKDRKARGKAY